MRKLITLSGLAHMMGITRARIYQLVNENRLIPDFNSIHPETGEKQYFFSEKKALRYAAQYQEQKNLPDVKRRVFV